MEGISISKMSPALLEQVQSIEEELFTTPWSISSFRHELESSGSIFRVALLNVQVIGYICFHTILDETTIMNLAVLPRFRRRGVGSMLLRDALHENRRLHPYVTSHVLEVRRSNVAAIRLYEKFGFQVISKRKGYYRLPDEDAVVMGKEAGRGEPETCGNRG